MNVNNNTTKSIRDFSEYLIKEKIVLTPEKMANEFLSFFNTKPPIRHYFIDDFCSEIGIDEVDYKKFPDNMRGFHAMSSNGKITIILEKSPSHAGKIHTLYHELYEIICELMNKPQLKMEAKANLFSASVIMPESHFFEYMIRRRLMFSEIKTYYSEIATDSILLRINHLFKKRNLFHIAYFLKNSYAYVYASPEKLKAIADFQPHLSTLSHFDLNNNEKFLQRIADEAIQKLNEQPEDESTLIKLSRTDKIVLAEPILLDWNGAIKEIAIQIIDKNVFQNLNTILKEEKEYANCTIC